MSSFRKRTEQKNVAGTKTSVYNSQLITSTGNPSMDHIIGGGLQIGSLTLIEEDRFAVYSKVLAKYFLAEGVFSGQSTFVGSLDDDPKELVRKLPKPVENQNFGEGRSESSQFRNPQDFEGGGIRIAWRYSDLPVVNSEQSAVTAVRYYNLTEQIDEATLSSSDISSWEGAEHQTGTIPSNYQNIFSNSAYISLLKELSDKLESDKYSLKDSSNEKNILRICLTSLGSPLWYKDGFTLDLIKFLTTLKSIVRYHSAVCFITIPMHLINVLDTTLAPRIRNLFDISIELEAFAGSEKETNPFFKEYHGLLHMKRMTALNSLAVFQPETTDLAFKLRRKKFVIEKLHLPPGSCTIGWEKEAIASFYNRFQNSLYFITMNHVTNQTIHVGQVKGFSKLLKILDYWFSTEMQGNVNNQFLKYFMTMLLGIIFELFFNSVKIRLSTNRADHKCCYAFPNKSLVLGTRKYTGYNLRF